MTIRIRRLALLTGALALASAAPASAYMQLQLENTMISNYSVSGSAANDLPGPPPLAAQTPGPTPAMPKMLEVFQKGEAKDLPTAGHTAPRPSASPRLSAAPRR
jgi:hypothetical protein